jgi:hypothetical protein
MNVKETETTSDITYYMYFNPKYTGFTADTPVYPSEFLFQGSQIYENGFDYNALVVICKNMDATEGVSIRVKDLSNELLSLLSLTKKTAYAHISSVTTNNTITVKIETIY